MNEKIKNYQQLLQSGDHASRRIVLDIMEETLQRLDAYHRLRSILNVEDGVLHIGAKSWDLRKKQRIYLIGAGKACNAMALAVEEALGSYLSQGIAIVKLSEPADQRFRVTRLYLGGHPLPNEAGRQACEEIRKLIESSGPEDLFLCVMSGGSSALMSCPLPGISLEDEGRTADILLKSGAGIREINAVRRHISSMNGGRMAELIHSRGAELIGFNISDAVGNPPTGDIAIPWRNFSATPMGPDLTTLAEAKEVIARYELGQRLPQSVRAFFANAGAEYETPKAFPNNTYYQLNTIADSCRYAAQAAAGRQIAAYTLTSFIQGEALETGRFLAAVARETYRYGQPFTPPCLILSSGEAVTTISDTDTIAGHGGPSQEMALGFALDAAAVPGACLISVDSEGTDGTTCHAGGIADSQTLANAAAIGIDLHAALRTHGAGEALSALNGAVVTGNTGTNVCDINILYVPAPN